MTKKCENCEYWEVRKIGNFTFEHGYCSFLTSSGWGQIGSEDVDGNITFGDEIVTKPDFCCKYFIEKQRIGGWKNEKDN